MQNKIKQKKVFIKVELRLIILMRGYSYCHFEQQKTRKIKIPIMELNFCQQKDLLAFSHFPLLKLEIFSYCHEDVLTGGIDFLESWSFDFMKSSLRIKK